MEDKPVRIKALGLQIHELRHAWRQLSILEVLGSASDLTRHFPELQMFPLPCTEVPYARRISYGIYIYVYHNIFWEWAPVERPKIPLNPLGVLAPRPIKEMTTSSPVHRLSLSLEVEVFKAIRPIRMPNPADCLCAWELNGIASLIPQARDDLGNEMAYPTIPRSTQSERFRDRKREIHGDKWWTRVIELLRGYLQRSEAGAGRRARTPYRKYLRGRC